MKDKNKINERKVIETDIVVIGAGPVGLFSVFQAGMLNMKCHIIDALDEIGGQCSALYPEKPIYDIPAYPKIGASELIEKLKQQITPFSPTYHLGQKVEIMTKIQDQWQVVTSNENIFKAKAVIIAAGCGAFGPHKPPLANLESFEKTGCIKYNVSKISDFAGKRVTIAGGGDSAVDWTLNLHKVAARVSVVHRRAKFRAAAHSVSQIKELSEQNAFDLIVPYQLDSLHGMNGKLEFVRVKNLDGAYRDIATDILLPFFGLSMDLGPIAKWGFNLDKNHVMVDSSTMQTNLPGVFAIGDIASYKGKLKLILTGFHEAALAAHKIYDIVYPDVPLHFEYSTTKGVKTSSAA